MHQWGVPRPRECQTSEKQRNSFVATNMNSSLKRTDLEQGKAEQIALNDLLEVEACLRDMLQSTNDPTVLQRLYNLHREIQRYVAEVNEKNK